MALKSGYGHFLPWSYFSGAVVRTFTSTAIADAIADLAIRGIDVRTVTTYRGPVREKCYLDFFFADTVWLKVPAYPCTVCVSKKFR